MWDLLSSSKCPLTLDLPWKDTFGGSAGTLTLKAAMGDGSPLPIWLNFDAGKQLFSGTPGAADKGNLVISVTASDSTGDSQRNTFNVEVKDADDLPSWMHFDHGALKGNPDPTQAGTFVVNVRARDSHGKTVTDQFTFEIARPLELKGDTGIRDQHVYIGQPFTYRIPADTFSGADGKYSVNATLVNGSALPSWIKFDGKNYTFSGKPTSLTIVPVRVSATTDPAYFAAGGNQSVSVDFRLHTIPRQHGDGIFENRPKLGLPDYCQEENTIYEPMDKDPNNAIHYARDVTDCQAQCRTKPACGYYIWYEQLKLCHHALPTAIKRTAALGFTSGPAECHGNGGKGPDADTSADLLLKRMCMTNWSYMPLASRGRLATTSKDPQGCQEQCFATPWCRTFVYNTLTKACDLQDKYATRSVPISYQISGPRSCVVEVTFEVEIDIDGKPIKLAEDQALATRESIERAVMLTLGNYTPFHGREAGPPTPVVELGETHVRFKSGMGGDGGPLVAEVKLEIPPARAMYAHRILSMVDAQQILSYNLHQEFGAYDPQFMPDLAKENVHVNQVSNVRFHVANDHATQQFIQGKSDFLATADKDEVPGRIAANWAAVLLPLLLAVPALLAASARVKMLEVCWLKRNRALRVPHPSIEDDAALLEKEEEEAHYSARSRPMAQPDNVALLDEEEALFPARSRPMAQSDTEEDLSRRLLWRPATAGSRCSL
eukprot:TRINITY_DN9943_c0_g1_i1.p1 TRINITY_DN9943_c0_g1~~TRINITY_DN9943_c0_g1_i1.p1  ORF type:complete len:718 (-),score=108.97 TRINITY_DN9943_c0_g1_i1:176-2329(-)